MTVTHHETTGERNGEMGTPILAADARYSLGQHAEQWRPPRKERAAHRQAVRLRAHEKAEGDSGCH